MTSSKLKIGQKNAQIMESDFMKPQNWKISLYLSNLKFLGVVCDEIKLSVKKCFSQGTYHEKIESGTKMPPV